MKLPSATSLASLILIDSASFVLEPWRLSLKDFKWENLDSSLSQLEDLTKVEVVLPSTCTAEDEQYVVSQLPISQRREILHVKCKPKSGGPSGKN